MKKHLSSFFLILIFIVYVGYRRLLAPDVVPVVAAPQPDVTSPVTSSEPPVPTSTVFKPKAKKKQGLYRDGVYTGASADAYYGSVQVQVTVSGGQLSDVQFLQYPSDRATSNRINTRAMSSLRSEAIASQHAPVDVVSGATETTGAFNVSLDSALSQAQ